MQRTVRQEIQRHSELQPDQAAVVCTSFAPFSYRELQYLIDEVRKDLRFYGLSRNARIAIALPNGAEAALAIVAVACSAVAIPLNPQQVVAEVERCFTVVRPDAVLLFQDSDSVTRRVAQREGLVIIEAIGAKGGKLGFKIVVSEDRAFGQTDEPNEPDPDAPAFILQTSGTISGPKLIPRSHRNMAAAAAMFQTWFKLTPQDCSLSLSPVSHGQGLVVTVFMTLLTGGTVAFPADASKCNYSEWFGTLKPTWFTCSPTLHRLILDQTNTKADMRTGHSLRFILSGGAPLPSDIHEGLEHALGVPVLDHYGFSEAAQVATNLPPPGPSKRGTCGIPWPDTIIIVGEDGHQLSPGERGEIFVRGPTVMSGYLNAPELNRASFVDGWLKTGDIGSLDDEGFLTLHGRLNDLINRGGDKISPAEIDDALTQHPAVAEAAAFAIPHPRLGQDVAAAVVLRRGMTAATLELRKYLSERLASFKVPRRIIILDHLPKGVTDKVRRRQLSESFQTAIVMPVPGATINDRLLFLLRELWERLLKSGPLTIDDDFFEKGGDSLLATEMLIEVERLTGQAVPSSIMVEAATIRQLAQKVSEGYDLEPKPIIPMSSNGRQPPLVFLHGQVNGTGYYTGRLARLLGSDQPLIVVPPHGVGGEFFPRSVEAMAADHLALIRNAQPQGPYRLAGYCLAGLVAFEVARMLVAAGEKVDFVVMVDSPTLNARRSVQTLLSLLNRARPVVGPAVERAMAWAWYKMSLTPSERRGWMKAKVLTIVRVGCNRVLGLLLTTGAGEIEQEKSLTSIKATFGHPREYATAMSHYFPAPLAVRVIYFAADYNAKAWLRISSDLKVIKLSGDHDSVINDPTALAHSLRGVLRNESGANQQTNP